MSFDLLVAVRRAAVLIVCSFAAAACGDGDAPPADPMDDADGDTISDVEEGADLDPPRDTDLDGLPDFQDIDADDDGLLDGWEAGDLDLASVPVDTDGDGLADYVDPDSDANGIPDWAEGGLVDLDADLRWDFQDLDDDEDNLTDAEEMRGVTDPPIDTDGDFVANYRDIDSDDDVILDGHERFFDSDSDGLPDCYDRDSDNDGYSDDEEAGDTDIRTIPIDTDGDGIADFRDVDSDNDGLSDLFERTFTRDGVPAPMNPRLVDSDGDGTSDLIELAAGTDALDPTDDPDTRGDFVYVVEFEEPPVPETRTLQFGTALRFADVYFSLDETCSMFQEFDALQASVPAIVEELSCSTEPLGTEACIVADPMGAPPANLPLNCADSTLTCHDGTCGKRCIFDEECGAGYVCDTEAPELVCVRTCRRNADCGSGYLCDRDPDAATGLCREDALLTGCLDNLFTGVGKWNDLDTFHNDLSPQGDANETAAAVGDAGPGGGEVPYQAPACVADGDNCLNEDKNCATTGVGCVGFRPDAVRVLVQITDADNQCGTDPRCALFDGPFAGAELQRQGIYFISLFGEDDAGGEGTPESVAREIGIASGTLDEDEEPFVFPAVDEQVVTQTVASVRKLVGGGNFRITADVEDELGDAGDSLQFVERLVVNRDPALRDCTPVLYTVDADGDGFDDTFPRLRPGTPVCWDLVARQNDFVRPTDTPLVYRARVVVRANGSKVDERRVFFLVPPVIEQGTPG